MSLALDQCIMEEGKQQIYSSSGSRQCPQDVASLLVIHTYFVAQSTEGRAEIVKPSSPSAL